MGPSRYVLLPCPRARPAAPSPRPARFNSHRARCGTQAWVANARQRRAFQERIERQLREGYDDDSDDSILLYDEDAAERAGAAPPRASDKAGSHSVQLT